jgi:beta-ribofuranosylaminobenzene 5'-phosphate synthase
MTKIFVRTPSRIAMSLLDMNGELGRVDGGPGFSIQEPCLEFLVIKDDSIVIEDQDRLSDELKESANLNLRKLKERYGYGGIRFIVRKSIPEHSGFGSKTSTLLSLGKAYGLLHNEDLSYRNLAILFQRGGTSGVGVNIIDKGGFIVEGGHSTAYKKEFLPSSASRVVMPPPLLARYDMPDWDILVAIPDMERTFGEKERRFFKDICPIPKEDVEELSRIILVQLMPAVIENNLPVFYDGVNRIQELTWKKNEIGIYGEKVKEVMDYGLGQGALAAGMSSIGTAVYFFGSDLDRSRLKLKERFGFDDSSLFLTRPNNKGLEYKLEK